MLFLGSLGTAYRITGIECNQYQNQATNVAHTVKNGIELLNQDGRLDCAQLKYFFIWKARSTGIVINSNSSVSMSDLILADIGDLAVNSQLYGTPSNANRFLIMKNAIIIARSKVLNCANEGRFLNVPQKGILWPTISTGDNFTTASRASSPAVFGSIRMHDLVFDIRTCSGEYQLITTTSTETPFLHPIYLSDVKILNGTPSFNFQR